MTRENNNPYRPKNQDARLPPTVIPAIFRHPSKLSVIPHPLPSSRTPLPSSRTPNRHSGARRNPSLAPIQNPHSSPLSMPKSPILSILSIGVVKPHPIPFIPCIPLTHLPRRGDRARVASRPVCATIAAQSKSECSRRQRERAPLLRQSCEAGKAQAPCRTAAVPTPTAAAKCRCRLPATVRKAGQAF